MAEFLKEIVDGVIRLNIIPQGGPGTTVLFIINVTRNALILLFAVIILVAIFYTASAGLKYIRSEGESDKIEEAQNALRAVFIGILATFIGVIGVFVITGIFSNQGADQIRESLCTFLEPNVPAVECVGGSRG